jgi:glycine betaine/choline ABC-type transport system substrate-binding protein
MDLGLLSGLEQSQVDMIAASATDGMLSKLDLKAWTMTNMRFLRTRCIGTTGFLRDTPGFGMLNELSGKFSNECMRELNYLVDGRHQTVTQVASDFLKQSGL